MEVVVNTSPCNHDKKSPRVCNKQQPFVDQHEKFLANLSEKPPDCIMFFSAINPPELHLSNQQTSITELRSSNGPSIYFDDPTNQPSDLVFYEIQTKNNIFNTSFINQTNVISIPSQSKCLVQYHPYVTSCGHFTTVCSGSGCPKSGTVSSCSNIKNVKQMKEYLQLIISGNKNLRFNKKTLHYFYNLLAGMFCWSPLTRDEKRNKNLVFQKLFKNRNLVIDSINKYPSIIEQVFIIKGA
ncbi:hypothetical protein M9Y10_020424 [Tritrichomonas musculus]|uniref:Uncharacterized protein n=1 Tax=Tritrichomonas musculus TaxID=1915356 RepID=A0ABR2HG74_9EUKA